MLPAFSLIALSTSPTVFASPISTLKETDPTVTEKSLPVTSRTPLPSRNREIAKPLPS